MRRFSPLLVLVLCLSCAEPPEVEQERTALEAQLLERQVVLADLELFHEGVDALGRRVRAMRAQLGAVNLPLLAQGLNEEAATGRLLQQEGAPDVIIMNGPGPVDRAVAALEQAALRAPGLRVRSLTVADEQWVLRCQVDDDLPQITAPTLPAPFEPPWHRRGDKYDEVVRLRAEVAKADAAIGVSIEALGQQQWEADLLEARLRSPSRLGQLPPLLKALLGGERPPVASLELAFEGEKGSATATLRPGASAKEVGERVPAASITRDEGGVLGLQLGG